MMEFKRMRRHHTHTLHEPDSAVLALSGVRVQYEAQVALEGISFQLEAGDRVAVVGPNGAGKSTLFKAIAGILTPTQGQINVYGHRPRKHVCIAYVPQRSQVDWTFPVNVADVVMMGRIGQLGMLRRPGKKDRNIVRACMETLHIEHLARRQIGALSGGQQQRMAIARALAQQAELMLMDEPLTGLDVNSQKDILEILGMLRGRGVTTIVALHDLDLAARHFDKVLLLNKRLLGFGKPDEVFTAKQLAAAYGVPDGEKD